MVVTRRDWPLSYTTHNVSRLSPDETKWSPLVLSLKNRFRLFPNIGMPSASSSLSGLLLDRVGTKMTYSITVNRDGVNLYCGRPKRQSGQRW